MKTSYRFACSAGVVAVLSGLSLPVAGAAPDPAAFVGVKTCGMCHKKDETGNQLASWQNGPHAKAFAKLASPEAKAAGAKASVDDPQKSGKCLKCHATAYNGTETAQIEKIAVEDGVTCESCHGAGKEYKSKTVMQDRAQAVAAGLIYPATKSCEACHNSQAPSWNPERYTTKDGKKTGFDVIQAFEKIKHPNPAAKK
ncbi:MAG: cytochrome c family protein [Kiritimatiellaeota bacterium]|nr:cytochrome c family protein [Kiritimatiellota bacterium]